MKAETLCKHLEETKENNYIVVLKDEDNANAYLQAQLASYKHKKTIQCVKYSNLQAHFYAVMKQLATKI